MVNMDTELIFWKAIELEPECEMVLPFAIKETRNSIAKSLKIQQQSMVQEYGLTEAENISIKEEDAPNGIYLIRIVRELK
ncbi:MAG: hypothetical protein A4E66_00192 [Syntrophus sp. PtaB.Bin001]|nr:MAG: hypothetical protein A4E66_00192 [Syntrophus sp. PtaB.Bin001]